MKKIKLLLFVTILVSCQQKKAEISADNSQGITIENYDWLVGNWQRTNDEEGRTTYEKWSKKSADEYLGKGFTLHENDTISNEELHLIKENETWSLKVIVKEDTYPTVFQVTQFDRYSFICENPENEFPKKIKYSIQGNKLVAVISNQEMEIPFYFEKK